MHHIHIPLYPSRKSISLVIILFVLLFNGTAKGSLAFEQGGNYSTHAIELLQQMADSYAALTTFEQKTVFRSSMVPINAKKVAASSNLTNIAEEDSLLPRIQKISFQSPNQFALELRENGENDSSRVEMWISDGSNFYTYQQAKKTYTKDKAPGRLRDFIKLNSMTSGSLEVLMMMGVNPFKDIKNLVQSVQMDDTNTRSNSSTDCILLKMTSPYELTELRLTLDLNSHLLLRLALERTAISSEVEAKHPLGDALDELDTAALPPASSSAQPAGVSQPLKMKTLFSYDNTISLSPHFNPSTFTFIVPKDTSRFIPFDPTGKQQKKNSEEQIEDMLKGRGIKKRVKIFK